MATLELGQVQLWRSGIQVAQGGAGGRRASAEQKALRGTDAIPSAD